MRIPKPTHAEAFVVVEGFSEFPLDMLRYDSCVPDNEIDSAIITRSHAGPLPSRTRILLRRYVRLGVENVVTPERWQSFGWKVICVSPDRDFALASRKAPS